MTHSFYAGMGGFVIDTEDRDLPDLIDKNPRLSLTAQGVLFLANHGHDMSYISETSIKDRSKADGLAKLLVCLQSGYMIVQYAGRLAAHLPMTLLEINTLGHVLCALIMYLFWREKPQDIHDATIIPVKNIREITAFMFERSLLNSRFKKAIMRIMKSPRLENDLPRTGE